MIQLSTLGPLMNERHRAILSNGLHMVSDRLLIIHQSWNSIMNWLVFERIPLKMAGGCPSIALSSVRTAGIAATGTVWGAAAMLVVWVLVCVCLCIASGALVYFVHCV